MILVLDHEESKYYYSTKVGSHVGDITKIYKTLLLMSSRQGIHFCTLFPLILHNLLGHLATVNIFWYIIAKIISVYYVVITSSFLLSLCGQYIINMSSWNDHFGCRYDQVLLCGHSAIIMPSLCQSLCCRYKKIIISTQNIIISANCPKHTRVRDCNPKIGLSISHLYEILKRVNWLHWIGTAALLDAFDPSQIPSCKLHPNTITHIP